MGEIGPAAAASPCAALATCDRDDGGTCLVLRHHTPPQERACLTLVYATLITAAQKWRGILMTPRILRALDQLRGVLPIIAK